MPIDQRPDPDQLLAELKAEEARAQRGRLKVFFGANAGVGKTYAMLVQARAQAAQGVDVVAGLVETHGRLETQAMLDGLPALPRRAMPHQGRTLSEFDLDAALARAPGLLLVDELAHSNVAGSRHPKRWQDIDELLAAGIDVYTTVNVQHLESLNDVVGQLTGVRVRETVPDHVFDAADDVVLVDLPPDELLGRLAEGKVYLAEAASRAREHFFRKSNLIALRELALRRTAERVDAERRASGSATAEGRVMVVLPYAEQPDRLVRHAARLAGRLKTDWFAVLVESPRLSRDAAMRARLFAALKFAESLGAETATLPGRDVAATIAVYAGEHEVSTVIIGETPRRWLSGLRSGLAERVLAQAPGLAIQSIRVNAPERAWWPPVDLGRRSGGMLAAAIGCGISSALLVPLSKVVELPNVVMLYLVSVLLVSVRFGRTAGATSALLSVAAFDFFFVPPQLSFNVSDTQYLLTFIVMLGVALTISQLSARLRFQADAATRRERRTAALYELSQALAAALTHEQVVEIALAQLAPRVDADVGLALPSREEVLSHVGGAPVDLAVADWVFRHGQPAGRGTGTLPASSAYYLPLAAPVRVRGVLALTPRGDWQPGPEHERFLSTCAAQIALALERVHFVEVAQEALVSMQGEQLRNNLLSTISHDLRTPLTVLHGLASTLASQPLAEVSQSLAVQLVDETRRMNELVANLLDMARLQSGEVRLRRDWQSVEEVFGATLRAMGQRLAAHRVVLAVPADLPLVEFDAVLIERVLVNLLDNAAKYTPAGSTITLAARAEPASLLLLVSDTGPGLPTGQEEALFAKFSRGTAEGSIGGVGLGLALCRAIVHAHGGTISAASVNAKTNDEAVGAMFTIRLPRRPPPALPNADPDFFASPPEAA
ncbi:sensor histidine kinase [Jeongeupia naejangsanensis]|uniref:histidine kinase n=1 Tax=Jeongeupia naejangsanensis TaxID=613195 RepID=A0ABS2BHI1_9NEIS|nr:sensor histidine kinase KdpD [Jeongeupia naejangsanensis]MBM3115076.1 sensor histidine kinase KdpD [Jeongeupia naejangsanensis]